MTNTEATTHAVVPEITTPFGDALVMTHDVNSEAISACNCAHAFDTDRLFSVLSVVYLTVGGCFVFATNHSHASIDINGDDIREVVELGKDNMNLMTICRQSLQILSGYTVGSNS
mgnify:CR=1 FL=1